MLFCLLPFLFPLRWRIAGIPIYSIDEYIVYYTCSYWKQHKIANFHAKWNVWFMMLEGLEIKMRVLLTCKRAPTLIIDTKVSLTPPCRTHYCILLFFEWTKNFDLLFNKHKIPKMHMPLDSTDALQCFITWVLGEEGLHWIHANATVLQRWNRPTIFWA